MCITVVFVYCFRGIFVHKCMGKMLKKQNQREMKRTESSKSEEKKSEKSDDRIKKEKYMKEMKSIWNWHLAYFPNVGDMKKV